MAMDVGCSSGWEEVGPHPVGSLRLLGQSTNQLLSPTHEAPSLQRHHELVASRAAFPPVPARE
jgi:hypothetical protein